MSDFGPSRNPPEPASPEAATPASRILERLVARSRAALTFERVWRLVVALATILGFFLAVSWAGLWLELGPWGRIFGVGAFALAAAAALFRGLYKIAPRRIEALARLDAAPGADHRLASSMEDTLAGERHDPATRALWALHRRRLEDRLRDVDVPPPAPRVVERDPFALRALALLSALAAAFVAGPDRETRVLTAFEWGAPWARGESPRIDAWLDPPAYTGRPPVVLTRRDKADGAPATISAPVNSILTIRASGGRGPIARATGGLVAVDAENARPRPSAAEREEKFRLAGDARLELNGAASFELSAIQDRPPTIEWTKEPRNNARGTMTVEYRIGDDYGASAAEAVAERPLIGGKPAGRALYPPPRLPLALPASPGGLGEARATLDFSDSPWGGARVVMTLTARDDGGNEGASTTREVMLPQRRFSKPLARALAEQRRNLALDPDRHGRTLTALRALALGADFFQTPSSIQLGLNVAKARLERARGDDDLREVADLLWAMALGLEEGDVSQAERDLRAAQEALREALARGADEEEIARLTDELRGAMDKFLQGLAQREAAEGAPAPQREAGADRALSRQDLQAMLGDIENAEKSGDLAQARDLLDRLQDILENLAPSRAGRVDPRAREMSNALDEMDRLSREQQQLRDETDKGRQSAGAARRGRTENERAKDMRSRQQALRQRLERQQDRLRRLGEEAPQDLSDADKAMKEAEKALEPGSEDTSRAVDAQGRALQALRRGADQLASRMQQGEGEEGEEGQSGRPGRRHGLGQGESADPLGRPSGRRRGHDSASRYDPLGLPPGARARRLQEELRRRLGQPERPAEELDYLERLLRR